MDYGIVVHGGAGHWRHAKADDLLEGVRRAAEEGQRILAARGSALEAVVHAVTWLEDAPVFNAGTGAALNLAGEAEMDAGVMVGSALRSGNVAGLRRVRNPVQVARQVMEQTDHVLLAGEGALRFARAMGFADYDPITEERRRAWRRQRDALHDQEPAQSKVAALLRAHPELAGDTVGAVACDAQGGLAAATSTGGLTLKLPGRVGDTPVPGAGHYASDRAAVSATGHGELMLRWLTAKAVADAVAGGASARDAAERVLRRMTAHVGDDVGVIVIDADATVGIVHGTPDMPYAYATAARPEVTAALG